MITSPRRLDPRNLIATTPPLFVLVGVNEQGQAVEHPFPAIKLWPDELTLRMNRAYKDEDEATLRQVFADVIGPVAFADYQRAGGTMMMLSEEFAAATQESGETDLGESSGSTTSSEASGAIISKPPSDANTVSTSGETLIPIS